MNGTSLTDAVDVARTPGVALADLAEHWWTRTASQEPVVRAMVTEPERLVRLRRQAAVLEERYPSPASRPPLFGALVAVKDIFHADGFRTRAGSRLPPDELTGEQGPAVTRLLDAAALVLGKTATTEFAYFDPPPTRNPRDINRTPGGSSSGSAAAVAAGYCPLALGSQTAGSVIRPAAFCGVVGTKPTYGRVPTDGVIALAPSFDTIGWFTSDVAGARLAASVVCDDWREGVTANRPRLGVPAGAYLEQTEPAAVDAFEAQLAALSDAGFEIERIDVLDDVELLNAHHLRLMQAEAAVVHQRWFDRFRELYRPALTALIVEGRDVGPDEADAIRGGRSALRAALEAAMDEREIDVWTCPAAPGPAPFGLRSTGSAVMNIPWTHAGMPVVTVPSGTLESMPLGLQLVARAGADEELFMWAARVEDALRPD